MYDSVVIRNLRGQHYVTLRTHDLAGTDYTHLFRLTLDQAKALAAGGEDFLHTPIFDITDVVPARLSVLRGEPGGEGVLYLGNEALGSVGAHIVRLLPERVAA